MPSQFLFFPQTIIHNEMIRPIKDKYQSATTRHHSLDNEEILDIHRMTVMIGYKYQVLSGEHKCLEVDKLLYQVNHHLSRFELSP